MTLTSTLPSFGRPPVNEVICGITFKPIASMLAPHLGILWSKFRDEYPICREANPLLPVKESFDGEEIPDPDPSIPLLPRIWFVSQDENSVVQVQRDRFMHNWRRVRSSDMYPRYEAVKERFRKRCEEFETFLSDNNLDPIQLLQLEMTYLNHIPIDGGWHSLGEIGRIFPDFNWRQFQRFLDVPERINWRSSFILPDRSGRLHLSIQSALRRDDQVPVLIADLTVRGIGDQKTLLEMWPWFDTARQWIVRGFADVTGEDVQKNVWKKQS